MAGLEQEAKYIVFRCADTLSGAYYYESCDLDDAFHPQTIIAHRLNGEPLPPKNGAPLRLRIERQLGYKHAKYLTAIEAVASYDHIDGGGGGYWEDRGYQWYAGV
jgi:DMSO/TMAO reductase YedYZ molybdopterin-dependent catalytic subunit